MLESLTLIALIERCAPGQVPTALAAIVREASGREPLTLVTIESGRPLPIQASTKSEAIALATEMRLAGAPLRLGLAGIDGRDLDRLGISLSDAFDPCTNLRAAAQLLAENPNRRAPSNAAGRLAKAAAQKSNPLPGAASPEPVEKAAAPRAADPARTSSGRPWDVYAQGLRSSALVYTVRE